MADAREARRQRILKRSADRLAFITGERKSLPTVAAPADVLSATGSETQPEETAVREISQEEEQVTSSEGNAQEASEIVSDGDQSLQLQKPEPPAFDHLDNKVLRQPYQEEAESLHDLTKLHGSSRPDKSLVFWKAVSASIDASRLPRALFSMVVALIVAIQGTSSITDSSNTFTSLMQPALVLFTTSIALVLGMTLLQSRKKNSEEAKQIGFSSRPAGLASTLGSIASILGISSRGGAALTTLLLVRKVLAALSADMSIYLVTVVCTMSFVRE